MLGCAHYLHRPELLGECAVPILRRCQFARPPRQPELALLRHFGRRRNLLLHFDCLRTIARPLTVSGVNRRPQLRLGRLRGVRQRCDLRLVLR